MTRWNRQRIMAVLLVAVFLSTFARTFIPPMLIGMSEDFSVTLATITGAASAYFLLYGLAQPVWGIVSDRIGRIPTMRLALVIAGAAEVATTIPMPFEWFLVVRAVSGAAMAGCFPAALIYIGDSLEDPRERGPAIATLMSGVAIGLAGGALLGGISVDTVGWRLPFLVTAVVAFALVWVARDIPPPAHQQPAKPLASALRIVLTNGWAWMLFGLVFVEAMVLLGGLALVPAAMELGGTTAAIAGTLTAVYGVAVLATSYAARRAAARLRASWLLLIGGTAATVGFALIALGLSPALVIASVVLQGVAWVFMHSTLQTWATGVAVEARATIVSFFAGFMFLGNAAGAFLAGITLEDAGSGPLFAAAAGIAAALTLAASLSRRRFEHRLG